VHQHNEDCRWSVKKDGKRRCLNARSERERAARALNERTQSEIRRRDYFQPPDGLEDEYGPVPFRVPNIRWYDEVIVLRLLSGTKTGRKPTTLEWRAFFERNKRTTYREVMNATGLNAAAVQYQSGRHGYRWPVELTGMADLGKRGA
jgi:hypothetical protein